MSNNSIKISLNLSSSYSFQELNFCKIFQFYNFSSAKYLYLDYQKMKNRKAPAMFLKNTKRGL